MGHLAAGLALRPIDRMLALLARDVHPPRYYLVLSTASANHLPL